MDCFQDFCLFCDRDSPDGPYCSQQCKLADLEQGSSSIPSSPTSPTSTQSQRNWESPHKMSSAYTFQSQQHHRTPGSNSARPRSSYFMWNPSMEQQTADERQLTPSSSRTSLSSTSSASTATASGGMSSQAKQQLQDYFSSFDQARAARRRSSLR